MRALLPLVLASLIALPSTGGAQTIAGIVVEEGRDVPIAGALVSLADRDGLQRVATVSDSAGRFRLTPPAAGEYYVEATRLGYVATRSPLIALVTEGTAALELVMQPQPIGLEGFEVSVEGEAEVLLGAFGLSPARLRNRLIDRLDIERMTMPGLPKDLIRWQNIAGVTVDELDPGKDPNPELCVRFRRSPRACAVTVLNGAIVPRSSVFHLDPHSIEAIAILEPIEAVTFYGTEGGGGAVLIWTRRGGDG